MRRHIEASTKLQAPIERVRAVLAADSGVLVADRLTPLERQEQSFHTRLTVRAGGGNILTLRGAYTVPLGPVGRVGELLAGKRLAHQSLVAFLEQAARRLDAEVARRAEAVSWHPPQYPVSVREVGPEAYLG